MIIDFPADKYPETAAHILKAIKAGESSFCTIDRDGADENRDESLDGIPTKDGYDRDEWPMAMCAEGGLGANIEYISQSDNRGAGSWVGNQLEGYDDGTRVLFVIDGGSNNKTITKPAATAKATAKPTPIRTPEPTKEPVVEEEIVYYANCTAVRAAGADPIYEGDPGYSYKLDRDKDGVACE